MVLLVTASCVREDAPLGQQDTLTDVSLLVQKSINNSEDAVPGTLVLLLEEKVADAVASGQAPAALSQACEQVSAQMSRVFPYKGTELERRHNMHRWYSLTFPSDVKVEDVAALFNGEAADWSKFGSNAGKVAAIGREAGSGTRDGFESITKTKDKCKLAQELTSTGAVIEAVKNSEAAIGYASYASVENQKGIKVLKVNGVECSEENISNGKYVIQRPFNLITKEGAQLSEAAQAFFDFMTSKAAAELIVQAGAVPTAK